MSWLFVARLRPFVLLAGAASLPLNLTPLMPSICMMQVPQADVIRLDGADIARWDRDALGKHVG